jgi:hypothetical protein
MALRLAELVAGTDVAQAIQLRIEYDPEPPLDAGSPDKAPSAVVEAVRRGQRAQERAVSEPARRGTPARVEADGDLR